MYKTYSDKTTLTILFFRFRKRIAALLNGFSCIHSFAIWHVITLQKIRNTKLYTAGIGETMITFHVLIQDLGWTYALTKKHAKFSVNLKWEWCCGHHLPKLVQTYGIMFYVNVQESSKQWPSDSCGAQLLKWCMASNRSDDSRVCQCSFFFLWMDTASTVAGVIAKCIFEKGLSFRVNVTHYQLIFIKTFTCGHGMWAVTERTPLCRPESLSRYS